MWPPTLTACECQQPGWCARHQCEKSRVLFEFCRRSIELFQRWEAGQGPRQGRGQRFSKLPRCQHRGFEPVGEVDCDLCGGQQMRLPLYLCELFGVCTERRYGTRTKAARETVACTGCRQYAPLAETAVPQSPNREIER